MRGYRDETAVAPDSQTETFAALRAEVDNWRWAGMPFHLRSGKKLGQSRQVITLGFKQPTLRMFPVGAHPGRDARANELVIDFSDPGCIAARFLAKEPGPSWALARRK